jgi:hypothetical protein
VAKADEIAIDTLTDKLRDEAMELDACLMPPPLIGAWSRETADPAEAESVSI